MKLMLLSGHLHHLCVGVGLAESIRLLRGYGLPAEVEQEAAHPLVRSVDPFLGAGGGRGVATEADNEQSSEQLQHFG